MKLFYHFVGLILLGFLVSSAKADISLTLRNNQYLPPPIQELPIKADFYKTQENIQQKQQKFEETNYANSRYHVFEVHNHYKSSTGNGENTEKLTSVNNNYLPSQNSLTQEIRIEHINAPADFPLDDPSLDASYLGFATGNDNSNQQIIVKHGNKNKIPVSFPSNNRHILKEKSNKKQSFNNVQQSVSYQNQHNYVNKFTTQQKSQAQEHSKQPVQDSVNAQSQLYKSSPQNGHNLGATDGSKNSATHKQFKGPEVSSLRSHIDLLPQKQSQQNLEQHTSFNRPDTLPPRQLDLGQPPQNFVSNVAFKGPDYLPPHQQGPLQSQHSYSQNSFFKGPDYLPPHQQGVVQSVQNFIQNTPLLPNQKDSAQPELNLTPNTPFKGPDYLPPQQQTQSQQTIFRPSSPYKGPDNLPPQTNFNEPKHLPPTQAYFVQQQGVPPRPSDRFKGPDYLPPGKPQEINQNSAFKGPDYLPPYQQYVTYEQNTPFNGPLHHSSIPFKGPDYLPPTQSTSKVPFRGPDYLPPQENQVQQHYQAIQRLPTGYDFQKPPNSEQAIAELHKLPENTPQYKEVVVKSQVQVTGTSKQVEPIEINGFIASKYDFQKPENSINILHTQQPANSNDFQKSNNADQSVNQLHNLDSSRSHVDGVSYSVPSYSPPGYEFQKPANSEQALVQLHSQQNFQPSQTSQNIQSQTLFKAPQLSLQPFKGPDYLPPSTGTSNFKGPDYLPPLSGSKPFKGPEYLPPITVSQSYENPVYSSAIPSIQTSVHLAEQQASQVFKGPEYLPPANVQQSYQASQQTQFKGPEYLPPTVPTALEGFKPTIMYPLSSYMTAVKSSDRYGNRRPFSEYGPPKTTPLSASNDVSPMYREPASRPQNYAPTMSYTTFTPNQYQSTPVLSQQVRQALQTFMPEDIRKTTTTAHNNAPTTAIAGSTTLQANKQTTGKIRTVQIVNLNDVRTLKVLESLDNAGVKTIKILGPSHEQPMGDHRIIKVVSGSHDQSVQTVKIFNDHQDVTSQTNVAPKVVQNNGYLPPRHKRNTGDKAKVKGLRRA